MRLAWPWHVRQISWNLGWCKYHLSVCWALPSPTEEHNPRRYWSHHSAQTGPSLHGGATRQPPETWDSDGQNLSSEEQWVSPTFRSCSIVRVPYYCHCQLLLLSTTGTVAPNQKKANTWKGEIWGSMINGQWPSTLKLNCLSSRMW